MSKNLKIVFWVIIILVVLVIILILYFKNPLIYQIQNINMRITSTTFENYKPIPAKYTCDGENINPPLEFFDVPESAKSLVLIMDDPDATRGATWDHWVMWNIPAQTNQIQENSVPTGAVEGLNSWPKKGYGGPCPPQKEHRYFFKLYALDTLLNLSDQSTKQDVENAMSGHIMGQAELVGLYKRQ